MKVIEIFESIQGEGSFLGVPAIFIRLGGCNLHCPFCDTKNSWGDQGTEMEIEDIATEAFALNPKIVVITGGEPTIYGDELYTLAAQLQKLGKRVHLETNGSRDIRPGYFNWVVCSPKEEIAYRVCEYANELKYVVTPEFDPAENISEYILKKYEGYIWLQPEGSDMKNMWKKAAKLVKKYPELRVGVQLHKIMEVR